MYFTNRIKKPHTWVVYYLWLMIVVESYGFMVGLSRQSDYKYFWFLKDTFFQNAIWAYNIFRILYVVIFIIYFLNFIKNNNERIFIQILTLCFLVLASAIYLDLETLQLPVNPIMKITGSLLSFITILLFFLNLLKSNQIINLRTYFPFYVAMGYLFFLLSTTPLDIYFKYYDITLNESYVNLRATIYLFINIFLYSTLTLGFILCFWMKKSY